MRPPLVLTIDGSDAAGAAGIQADIKTLTALGVYAASSITQVTASGPQGVASTHPLSAEVVRAQLAAVVEGLQIDAVKIGTLGSAAAAGAVAETVRTHRGRLGRIVLDPVMVDADGTALISAEGARAVREQLVPIADVVTPNMAEAAQLLGTSLATSIEEMREQGLALRALGPEAVVITGGRLPAGDDAVDVVVHPGGTDLLRASRVLGRRVRGAGATFSAAIAAQLARIAEFARAGELGEIGDAGAEDDMVTIIATAREFVAGATEHGANWEIARRPGGYQALNHLITLGMD